MHNKCDPSFIRIWLFFAVCAEVRFIYYFSFHTVSKKIKSLFSVQRKLLFKDYT